MERVYLDHAATTPLAPEVLSAMEPYLTEHYGNASSVHRLGREARVAVEESRERVAACIGAEPSEIVFTSGGTESDNLALKGVLQAKSTEKQPAGVVTSASEHKAVLQPAKRLAEQKHPVTILDPDHHGAVSPEQVEASLDDRTVLVSLMHVNNETGVMTDIQAISDICREHDVILHCDAVQSVGLHAPDVDELGVDLMSISGHKLYGPKGIGVLYVRGGVDLGPLVEGGSQERERRGGTENVPGAVGLAEALERAVEDAEERAERLARLQQRLVDGLDDAVPGSYVLNTPVGDVLVSAGSACTSGALEPSHVLQSLGLDRPTASAAVRFSLGAHTTEEEIDFALDKLHTILQRMR